MTEPVKIETITAEKIHFAIADKLKAGVSYIDALCDYANHQNLEIETLAAVVRKSEIIKTKIRDEAIHLKLIKKDENDNRLCD